MKETLERQWPEEIEEHLLAVVGHNTDVKKQHNQMDGEREREGKKTILRKLLHAAEIAFG